jgi:hypothetical protein
MDNSPGREYSEFKLEEEWWECLQDTVGGVDYHGEHNMSIKY